MWSIILDTKDTQDACVRLGPLSQTVGASVKRKFSCTVVFKTGGI